MAKTKPKKNFFKIKNYILPTILSIVLLLLTILTYQLILADKYYPLTFVGDTNISFLTEGQAIRAVQSKFNKRAQQKLPFAYPQGNFTIDLSQTRAQLNYATLNLGFDFAHSGNFWQRLVKQLLFLVRIYKITPEVKLGLEKQISTIKPSVEKEPKNAQLIFDEITSEEKLGGSTGSSSPSARIQIKEAEAGLELDQDKLKREIIQYILTSQYDTTLPVKTLKPKVTTDHVKKAKDSLEQTLKEPLKLNFQDQSWSLDAKQLLTLLNLTSEQDNLLDKSQVDLYLQKIAQEIDQQVQEGLFEFNPQTKRVSAFKPSQEGRKLNVDQSYQILTDTLINGSTKTINLPVDIVRPKIQTEDVNSLGIKELIGRGISNFAGSIPNRIYNVGLTASKINGVLIPPGEIFSFNNTVGDITAATGFKQAYVIKEGRTVLDDGGGVCQDSTTLFRAVLNAGLPIIKRTAHAYRVGYYEQGFPPGLDATVFYPSVDFQFKNDTPSHILIQAYTSGVTLYVDLYGTPDERAVTLTKPIITNQTPPPPELRQDDPTLPKGTVKQVDWAAWGATVSFKRTVTKNGQTLADETWKSFYKPWQAIFLVGTQ